MTASPPSRWYQFRLGTLLAVMLLVALLARPAWQQLRRWQAGGWDYWRLFGRVVSHEQRQQAAVQRGLEWLQTHQGAADWNVPPHIGQSQESDL
jgi:hypothetical protein